MANPPKILTPDEVKADLAAQGITMTDWAKARGFNPKIVNHVLNGFLKGRHGEAHRVAVALRLKPEPSKSALV